MQDDHVKIGPPAVSPGLPRISPGHSLSPTRSGRGGPWWAACLTLVWLAGTALHAAPITWSSKVYPVNGGFGQNLDTGVIQNDGTLILAENVGGAAEVFDGISFAAGTITFGNTNPPGIDARGYHEGTGAGNTEIVKFGTYSGVAGASTVSLSGLAIGEDYRIQVLVFDGLLDGDANTRTVSVDGIDQGRYTYGTPFVTWGDGRIVTGVFTADATTQDFTIEIFDQATSTSLGGQLNAIVVHQVEPPTFFFNEGNDAVFPTAELSTDEFSSFRLGGAVNDSVIVANENGLSVVAGIEPFHQIDVEIEGPVAPGSYPLITYSGTIGGLGFGGLELSNVISTGRPYQVELANTGSSINLLVTGGGPADLTWTGAQNSLWDSDNTENWKFDSGGTPTTFINGDSVTFDDTATGTSPLAVTVDDSLDPILPEAVVIDNSLKNYEFSGDPISGDTTLQKLGTGTATFTNANAHTGGTTISAGRVRIGNGGSLGSGTVDNAATLEFINSDPLTFGSPIGGAGLIEKTGAGDLTLSGSSSGFTGNVDHQTGTLLAGIADCLGAGPGIATVASGATLDVNGIGFGAKTVHVQGTGVGGQGAIVNSGGLQFSGVNNLVLIGDTTIGGTGRWDVRGAATSVSGDFTLTKVGTNEISFVDGLYTMRDIVVTEGRLSVEYGATLDDSSPGSITLNGGSLGLGDYGNPISLTKPIVMNGGFIGTTIGGSSGNAALDSPITLSGTTNDFAILPDATVRLNGGVGGPGTLRLRADGGGTLVLAAAPAHAGNTVIEAGTLALEQPGLADGSTVEIAAAAILRLDFAGTDTVDALTIDGVPQPDGVYSASHPSGRFAGSTGSLIVGAGSPYQIWAGSFAGLTDDDTELDFEGDGLDTGIEYVVGGDPTANDAAAVRPTMDLSIDPTKFLFTFRRTDLAAGDPSVTITVEYGSDLMGWATATHDPGGTGVTIDVADVPDADYDLVTVGIPKSLAPDGRLFARLQAVFP